MIKILMHGCNGRMGQMIAGLIQEDEEAEIVAGVDTFDGVSNPFPVFSKIGDCNVTADVVRIPGHRWCCVPRDFLRNSLPEWRRRQRKQQC